MSITNTTGWKNQQGTASLSCSCGSWKQHWLNYSSKVGIAPIRWPTKCSVAGCSETPTLGAHVIHPYIMEDKIIPMCDSCNGLSSPFNLKEGVTCASANVYSTCY